MLTNPFARFFGRAVAAILSLVFTMSSAMPAQAAEGVLTAPSRYSVATTAERLEAAIRTKDYALVAKVDHAAGGEKVGMMLRPTILLVFGNPRGGTPLMIASQSTGLDLPLKMLVSEDAEGKVLLSWNDPVWIARRHGIDPGLPVVKAMTNTLAALAAAAGQE